MGAGCGQEAASPGPAGALQVMSDQRAVAQARGERPEVAGVPGDDALAVAARPAVVRDRDRDWAVGEVGGRALFGLDLDRLLDHAAGDDLVPLVVKALDDG